MLRAFSHDSKNKVFFSPIILLFMVLSKWVRNQDIKYLPELTEVGRGRTRGISRTGQQTEKLTDEQTIKLTYL